MTNTTNDSAHTRLAVRLIESVINHARNQAAHNAAVNAWDAAGDHDKADVRRQGRDREEELVTARANQLADLIRELAARIVELEAEAGTLGEGRMRAARQVALWHIGDGSWADLIVGAYLNPEGALEALRIEKEQ